VVIVQEQNAISQFPALDATGQSTDPMAGAP
jgi:hypothetical protein